MPYSAEHREKAAEKSLKQHVYFSIKMAFRT
jgi:hypothetical protein